MDNPHDLSKVEEKQLNLVLLITIVAVLSALVFGTLGYFLRDSILVKELKQKEVTMENQEDDLDDYLLDETENFEEDEIDDYLLDETEYSGEDNVQPVLEVE